MAKKKKILPVVHPPTKRQLSHWQQQKRRQRIIFSAGMAVIAAVLIIIGSGVYFGWYVPEYRPLHEVVVKVNDNQYTMGYLIDFVTNQYGQYASMALDYGVTNIEDFALIRQQAEKMGYSVTEKEIDDALKGAQVKETAALRDAIKAQLLAGKLRDEYFKPQLPATAPQRQVMALFVESLAQANEIKTAIQNGTDFGILASEKSLDETTKTKKGDLGWHPREVLPGLLGSETITDSIFNQTVGSIEQVQDKDKTKQVGYWLVKVTERKDDGQAHVFGILTGSEDEAKAVKARLDAGEDFNTLAKEFSQVYSEENGADMGWVPADSTDAAAEFIFNSTIPLNTISSPIKDTNATTKGGYWVVKVVAAEDRALSTEDQDTLIGQMFDKWLNELRDSPDTKIESLFDQTRKDWALSYLESKA